MIDFEEAKKQCESMTDRDLLIMLYMFSVNHLRNENERIEAEIIKLKERQTASVKKDPEDEQIVIEDYKFRRGDICDIYDCERDKTMFLNREAGFIVKRYNDACSIKFSEPIAYESYPNEIATKKQKWKERMNKAIKLWENN